ncbi:MAG: DNA polymerase III subunit alpha [Planctomycetota bacterium]|nr:DNA polymerase III subunit alpha [Planctomycetota bacterium]
MSRPDFVHLHVHSEYSLLDGANRIGDLVEACQADEQRAIALTDHGNMFGAIELHLKCKKGGIKPIIGCEVYVAKHSRVQPHSRRDNRYHHLTLLARNEEGHDNLIKLATLAYTEGFHYRPRIDKELLEQYGGGISCLSGCLGGEINQLFLAGKHKEAEQVAGELRDIFGPDHFWLELQRNGIQEQDDVNEHLIRLSSQTAIPLVATNDIHYLRAEDCAAQDTLLCINTGARRDDPDRFRFDTKDLFFKTRQEMAHMFRDEPKSIKATMDVTDQIELDISSHFADTPDKYHLPVYVSDTGESPEDLFDRLCEEGIVKLYGGKTEKGKDLEAARVRLAYEKSIIVKMGFISYFLIVWDIILWSRANGVSVGPGRGSAAGSLIAYALDITRVCPLEYDLLFERFLNEERVSMPDIDIDFCKEGREKVIEYTRQRYGDEQIAQIGTFGTMASRTVIRDVGRVLDIPLKDVDMIAKKVPAGPGAPNLRKALKEDKDLLALQKDHPEWTELFELGKSLEGLARHVSTHAAGIVIADKPIDEYVPLWTQDGMAATQWPGPLLEELGLLKMDYLGLRTLTIIDRALEYVGRLGYEVPDIDNLPLDDKKTYELLMAGDTEGIFQLESDGMKRLIQGIKPDCFNDLIAILALFRPGPLESGMADMFTNRKHGREEIELLHPSIDPLLADTYGCIVYQEQVMLISSQLSGFSLNLADNLRKAMGKKQPEIMEKFSAQFIDGAKANDCDEQVAAEIWANIVKFGGYGFNKSHSTAYALISYQTAYLKAHFRTCFLAANLSCEMQDSDKLKKLLDDGRRAGIEALTPDIRHSEWHFVPEGKTAVRFGLGGIKGTGQKAVSNVVEKRLKIQKEGAKVDVGFHEIVEAIDPHDVNKSTWEALIKAGCFDYTGHNRGAVADSLSNAMADASRSAADRRSGQGGLFGAAPEAAEPENPDDSINDAKAWDERAVLTAEHSVLGFYLSGHPLEEKEGLFRMLSSCSTNELDKREPGSPVVIAVLLIKVGKKVTKKGHKMADFRLEDLDGGVDGTVFPKTFEKFEEALVPDTIVVCRGKLEERITGDDSPAEVRMLLDEVMTVEDALGRFEGSLVIGLEPMDLPLLPKLKALIDKHPGERPLYLRVTGRDGKKRRIRTNSNSNVAISAELAQEIDHILGKGRAHLARQGSRKRGRRNSNHSYARNR